MTKIYPMTQGHAYWDKTIAQAEQCSWRAGPHLAKTMRKNDFLPWERVFCACVDGTVAGFCTLTETDALPPECGFGPFIGFVFVAEPYRGNRISGAMIQSAISYARGLGYTKLYLTSGEEGLYEKYGFEKLEMYKTIHGSTEQLFVKQIES